MAPQSRRLSWMLTALPRRLSSGEATQTLGERSLNIDAVVNSAGYGAAGAFDKSDLSTQLGMIDLNVRAQVELMHLFWPRILKNKRGGLLNVALSMMTMSPDFNSATGT